MGGGALKCYVMPWGGGKGVYESAQISIQIRRCRTVLEVAGVKFPVKKTVA